MKNRFKKIKREHTIIDKLGSLLEKVAQIDEVEGIIPGRIKPVTGNYPDATLELKYPTDQGFKCIGKCGRSVQEVFVITPESEAVIARLISAKILLNAK